MLLQFSAAWMSVPVGQPLHPLVQDPLVAKHHRAGHVQGAGVRLAGRGEVMPEQE